MTSKLSGKGDFELRGVVKPLVFFYRHLALLARCHLFSIQTTFHEALHSSISASGASTKWIG